MRFDKLRRPRPTLVRKTTRVLAPHRLLSRWLIQGLCLNLVVSLPALAAGFVDGGLAVDFETGTLLTSEMPAGFADSLTVDNGANTLVASPAAAHRGGFGLRMHDGSNANGTRAEGTVTAGGAKVSPHYAVRFWFRFGATLPMGTNLNPFTIYSSPPQQLGIASVYLLGQGASTPVDLGGVNAADVFSSARATQPLTPGTWALLELELTNLGRIDGIRTLRINGAQVATVSGIDWRGVDADRLEVGESDTNDGTFVGDLDFDDVRADRADNASTLRIVAPATANAQACTAASIELEASTGLPAPAPYPVTSSLALTGAVDAGFYAESTCMVTTSLGLIGTGATSTVVWVRGAQPGIVQLMASHPDFLSATTSLTLVDPPDAAGLDAGGLDAGGFDAAGFDAGGFDAGAPDANGFDSGVGTFDGGGVDGGRSDSGTAGGPSDGGSVLLPTELRVQCGCASAEGWSLVAFVVLASLWRRRARNELD